MVADNKTWNVDGQTYVSGGVNSGLSPDVIQNDQLAWGRNLNLRDGKPGTPWGLVERGVLPFGNVQNIKEFSFGGGVLVASISGRIYTITPDYSDIAIDEFILPIQRSSCARKSYMVETVGSFIIQDGSGRPLIFNGTSIRIAADDEIPLGSFMAFDGNRVWFIQGRRINALNIAIGVPGSELKFTEAQSLSGGGYFSLPGDPTGMSFMPSSDGTTSFGALIVFGKDWTLAFKANIGDRSQWLSTVGFKDRVFPVLGCVSNESIITSNTDMYWRDGNGELRNMRQAISDYATAGSTSASREVSTIIENESHQYLDDCQAIVFQNKMFMSGSPYFVFENDIAFRDMFTLDFTPIGTQGQKGKPIFDGERDGLSVTHLATLTRQGRKRAFAVSKEADGTNRLWEIVPEERTDIFLSSRGDRVESRIESDIIYRRFQFDSNFKSRTFASVTFWLTKIQGSIEGKVYYKRDTDEQWYLIDSFDFCTLIEDKSQAVPHKWLELSDGHQEQVITRTPKQLGQKLVGHVFQLRFIIKGVFELDKVLFFANPTDTPVHFEPRDTACRTEPITLVGEEYVIPVVSKTLNNYVDENGDGYSDENGDNYFG